MYLFGHLKDRLESNSLLADIASGTCFSAFSNCTNRLDIGLRESIFVAIDHDSILVHGKFE